MDEAEEAMLALEDAADKPTGWIIDPNDKHFFVFDPTEGTDMGASWTWASYANRMTITRYQPPQSWFDRELHPSYRFIRRRHELQNAVVQREEVPWN